MRTVRWQTKKKKNKKKKKVCDGVAFFSPMEKKIAYVGKRDKEGL